MVIFFSVILIGIAALLVVTPLFNSRGVLGQEPAEAIPLKMEREIVFSTLNEIEFDYQMKKLSDEDYEELKKQYQRDAVNLLNTLPAKKVRLSQDELERELEQEIARELEGIK